MKMFQGIDGCYSKVLGYYRLMQLLIGIIIDFNKE